MILTIIAIFLSPTMSQSATVEYTGAVVDYVISHDVKKSSWDNMMDNINRYQSIIAALPSDVDIVVFPENGLLGIDANESVLTIVPEPSWNMPNLSNAKILHEISKSAINSQVYVLVNLVEKVNDKKYNTNVVIRKNGTIAARYRKYNLFNEKVDQPSKPKAVWFDTEMGVRFGTFTCFDILFAKPALDLVSMGVRDILFSTHWFSELPFLTAGQMQRGWSWATNANLLASGVCDVKRGSTGSGLYTDPSIAVDVQGPPTPTYHFAETDRTTVLIRRMKSPPVNKKTEIIKPLFTPEASDVTTQSSHIYNGSLNLLGENLLAYKLSSLEAKNSDDTICEIIPKLNGYDAVRCNTTRKVCHGRFCCFFKVSMLYRSGSCPKPSGNPDEFWLFHKSLATFSGVRSFGGAATGGIDVCALVTCPHNNCSASPSSNPPTTPTTYAGISLCTYEVEKLTINGDFGNDKGFLFPSVISGRRGDSDLFGEVANDGNASVIWNGDLLSVQGGHRLGTAALLQRVFSRDGQSPTEPDIANLFKPSSVTIVILLLTLFILNY